DESLLHSLPLESKVLRKSRRDYRISSSALDSPAEQNGSTCGTPGFTPELRGEALVNSPIAFQKSKKGRNLGTRTLTLVQSIPLRRVDYFRSAPLSSRARSCSIPPSRFSRSRSLRHRRSRPSSISAPPAAPSTITTQRKTACVTPMALLIEVLWLMTS